jgi:hypothetical protein
MVFIYAPSFLACASVMKLWYLSATIRLLGLKLAISSFNSFSASAGFAPLFTSLVIILLVFTLLPSFWPPLGRSKRIAQFLAKLSNFSVFCLFSACRAKGLV